MRPKLKLAFIDFAVNWGSWPNPVRFFVDTLSDDFDIRVVYSDFNYSNFCLDCMTRSQETPDIAICSHPSGAHRNFDCKKIYFAGEPRPLNYESYDYAMSHHLTDDPRHHRLPIYPLYRDVNQLLNSRIVAKDKKFCCVLFGKPYPHSETPRETFFRNLCKYKDVDSAGVYLNNTGFVVKPENKAEFIKDYKFVLSFESCSLPGFTIEKCFEPLLMNTIPVYWGNPQIGLDFNTKGMINCHEFDCDKYAGFNRVIDRIVELDQNEEAYRAVIEQPQFVCDDVKKENIVKFFREVLG